MIHRVDARFVFDRPVVFQPPRHYLVGEERIEAERVHAQVLEACTFKGHVTPRYFRPGYVVEVFEVRK